MPISYEKADALRKELEMEYGSRHDDHRKLRNYWHGRYWEEWGKQSTGVASLFRDLRRGSTDSPDFKVVHNIIHEVCLKYQSYLSNLPQIRVYRDYGDNPDLKARQATKKERYLYGLWSQRPVSMSQILTRLAWYLPLMGDAFLGAYPDIEDKTIRPILRNPEFAYPVQSYDGSTLDSVIFHWETTSTKAQREFPKFDPDLRKGPLRRRVHRDKVKITEYSDGKEFRRWVDSQEVTGVEHNYGFNLFDQLNFIFVPDEPWNHGAVEQALSLNEAENLMRSLMLQAVIENIFPKYVLIDPSKAPEELDMGPGAVWGVNPGGDVKTLTPPLQALPVQQAFLQENERAIKQGTGMNEANFGAFPGGSTHITGKAINQMEGAGAGSLVELVQGTSLGGGLSSWNEKALCMAKRMFKNETLNITGREVGSAMDLRPKEFSFPMKGSEIVGSYRNEVVFQPLMDMHEKLVMNLQAMGAELVSKEHTRNQIGIPDSAAMDEEILGEKIQSIIVGAIEMELQAAPSPEAGQSAEQRAIAYLQGSTAPPAGLGATAPNAPPGAPAGPGGMAPPGAAPPGSGPPGGGGGFPVGNFPGQGGGQFAAPALRLPPGAPVPDQGAAGVPGVSTPGPGPTEGPSPQNPDTITLDEAVQAFQSIQTAGRVFLVGEIVEGQTADAIEVAVTDPSDRQTLADGLPQFAGRLSFTVVQGEPKERHVEVTSGATPEPAGEEADLEAILGGGA